MRFREVLNQITNYNLTKSEQLQINIKCSDASKFHPCEAQACLAPASCKSCVINVQCEIKLESLTLQQGVP